jgi:hypothetical protein
VVALARATVGPPLPFGNGSSEKKGNGMGFLDKVRGRLDAVSEQTPPAEPPDGRPGEPGRGGTGDPAGAGAEQKDAYERAQPDSQPTTSSEPEPDNEPADAG